jgi:membrane associated rhomboid family serine protease
VARNRRRFDASQLRITRGALIIAGLEIGLSLVYGMLDKPTRLRMDEWVLASAKTVFGQGRVWTLVTSPFLSVGKSGGLDFLGLLLNMFVLWAFVPTLERFWGTSRFYRFAAITSLLGTVFGCLVGLARDSDVAVVGLSPFVYASIVAFGVIYARQPVQFFGVLPLSARQLMYGFIGFLTLFVLLGQQWEQGGAIAAAMIGAAVMTSKRWSPALAWRRWRIARARARLSVIEGGKPVEPKPRRRRDERYLN